MLYEGRIRQVGSVEEIQGTEDPVVRQFIEGPGRVKRENSLPSPRRDRRARGGGGRRAVALRRPLGKTEAVYVARFRTVGGLGAGSRRVARVCASGASNRFDWRGKLGWRPDLRFIRASLRPRNRRSLAASASCSVSGRRH